MSENRGRKTEVRGQRTDDRKQKSEARGQRTDDRELKWEVGMRKGEKGKAHRAWRIA